MITRMRLSFFFQEKDGAWTPERRALARQRLLERCTDQESTAGIAIVYERPVPMPKDDSPSFYQYHAHVDVAPCRAAKAADSAMTSAAADAEPALTRELLLPPQNRRVRLAPSGR